MQHGARSDARSTDASCSVPDRVGDLEQVLGSLPGAVAAWDADGRLRYASAAYLSWFGLEAEVARGLHVSQVIGATMYALNSRYVEQALAGERQDFERTHTDARGVIHHHRVRYLPTLREDRPDGFVILVTDISSRLDDERRLQDAARQVALLEERERIAADLHDLVIQRLFAAGLDLAAAQRRGSTDHDARVDAAAVSVDLAIRELRGAIHSLHELMTSTQVPFTVDRLLESASRMLGFGPSMTYNGSVDLLPPEVIQDLLAVLNEALSNVARHAGATSVDIDLSCTHEEVLLRVADDGRGMAGADRSSGLSNMRQRAVGLGGTFACLPNEPRGTVVQWRVPVHRP